LEPISALPYRHEVFNAAGPSALAMSASFSAGLIRLERSWLDRMKEARRWLEDRKATSEDNWFA
jgi:hypothetical protein